MKQKYGILISCEQDENGNVTVTYDDVKCIDNDTWLYQGVVTSFTINKEKLDERPDYGLKEEIKEKGKIPLNFSIGSHLLSVIKARLL